jgi:hypothetical protein
MTFLAPRGTQFIGVYPFTVKEANLGKPKLFIGVGFHTKILFMTFLTPRGTKDSPCLLHFHCKGGKIWRQFTKILFLTLDSDS